MEKMRLVHGNVSAERVLDFFSAKPIWLKFLVETPHAKSILSNVYIHFETQEDEQTTN